MTEIVSVIIKWAVPFVFGSVITGCITYVRAIKRRNNALEDGVQCLLRAEIIRSYKEYTDRDYCPVYAREALSRAYKAYHGLNGNDVATELFSKTMLLPTEPPKGGTQ